jgi:hypothetical protein
LPSYENSANYPTVVDNKDSIPPKYEAIVLMKKY